MKKKISRNHLSLIIIYEEMHWVFTINTRSSNQNFMFFGQVWHRFCRHLKYYKWSHSFIQIMIIDRHITTISLDKLKNWNWKLQTFRDQSGLWAHEKNIKVGIQILPSERKSWAQMHVQQRQLPYLLYILFWNDAQFEQSDLSKVLQLLALLSDFLTSAWAVPIASFLTTNPIQVLTLTNQSHLLMEIKQPIKFKQNMRWLINKQNIKINYLHRFTSKWLFEQY
jgi:hypothetical protein